MFFTQQRVFFVYKNLTFLSLDFRTWTNFFKESFLVDFNYKIFFRSLVESFLFKSTFSFNHLILNKWQLVGLYNLLTFWHAFSGATVPLKKFFLVFFRTLLLWLLFFVFFL